MEAILILDKLSCRPCAQQDVRTKGPNSLSTQTQGDNQQPFSSLDSFSGSLSLPSAVTIFSQSGLQWDPIIPQLRSQKIKRNTAQRPRSSLQSVIGYHLLLGEAAMSLEIVATVPCGTIMEM